MAEGSTPSKRNRNHNHNHRRASARRRCTEKITIAQYGISRTTMAEYCSGWVCPDSHHSPAILPSVESPSWQARMHEAGKDTHLPCLPIALSPRCTPTLDVMQNAPRQHLLRTNFWGGGCCGLLGWPGVGMPSWNLDAEFEHDNLCCMVIFGVRKRWSRVLLDRDESKKAGGYAGVTFASQGRRGVLAWPPALGASITHG